MVHLDKAARITRLWFICLSLLHVVEGSFNVYAGLDGQLLKEEFKLSEQCLKSLNSTVLCDEAIGSMAASGPDQYCKFCSNTTKLCTQECAASLSSWLNAVDRDCDRQTVFVGDVYMLAKTVPTAWKEGYDLVCLQDSSSDWCFVNSQRWQGSDYIRWDPEVCYYEYEGGAPPECLDPDFSTTQMTKDMMDVTNLYEKDLLCSECFIKMWRQRLMSALLPSGEHTDYLLNQYSTIQEYCSTKLPVTTYETTLFASTRTMPVTATGTPLPSPTSCPGQLIEPSDSWMGCREISDKYNVSTGAVVDATQDKQCQFDTPLCLPKPCEIDTIWGKTTCEELAARYSTDELPISETQFLSWNPNILGACSWVHNSQRVCKGPPGGFFKASGVIYAPTTAGSYYTTAIPAEPTRPGTAPDCGRYYKHRENTDSDYQDSLWNNCTNLWLNYDICVAPVTKTMISEDGTCGPSHGNTACEGSSFGKCCSIGGYCGNTSEYCSPGNCVSGTCDAGGDTATQDGTCGPEWKYTTCTNPRFGSCCSIHGYCGSGSEFCGPGLCFSGDCDDDNGGPSVNGECGPSFAGNKTCTGTQFGKCCSVAGYCGSTEEYCGRDSCYSGDCH
ncbi:hypothetical protein BDV39DRAFT_216108 [Aspergillus sergii]|uniref:Chitin-binding type-1 domain-containing protein n=1 Tax=Aspergillus sergii TaxID=1034303 RepID=A0A5N6WYW8_9EURO|nr:hypothetical protein BDV39DRAFT_216108 [Aspergillus sergii]